MSAMDRLQELRGSSLAITLPMLVMVGVFVALGTAEGGYFPTAWLPAAMLAVALLATALVTVSTRAAVPPAVAVATGLFAAYAGWSYLSILWADDPGVALEGANRMLMYTAIFALFALWPMRGELATAVLGALGLAVAGLGLITLVRASAAGDASLFLIDGRLLEPVGYVNGNAALWFTGFFPCVLLSAMREVAPLLRGVAAGGAVLLAGLALLTQSRGWLFTLPLVLLVFVAVTPVRARVAVAITAIGAGVWLAAAPILSVYELSDEQAVEPLVQDAVRAILVSAALLVAAGLVVGLVDRRLEPSPRAARAGSFATLAVLGVAALASGVVATVALGNPVAEASQAWEEFKAGSGPEADPATATRFGTLATNRYDFWRVAAEQFRAAPLLGAGADNFQDDYLARAESFEQPRFPHSLELRVLGQTGLVGAALFAGAILTALGVALRATLRRSQLTGAVAGTAAAIFIYWVVHGSVDWFLEIPAVGAPAFAMLGLGCSLGRRDELSMPRRDRSNTLVGSRRAVAAGSIVALLCLVVLGLPWLSELQVRRAVAIWPAEPTAAFEALDRAATINPVSARPHTTAAAIALRVGDLPAASDALESALRVHPRSAYATLQLGAVASEQGDRRGAVELLESALALAPMDQIAVDALAEVQEGGRLDAEEVYDAQLERRLALTQAD